MKKAQQFDSGGGRGGEVCYTLAEVRQLLNVPRTTLWRMRRKHGLRSIRWGGVVRISKTDLDKFPAEHIQ
jgi:excisionase family DNA binding protein